MGAGSVPAVTSRRLDGAPVVNRLFPKMRSWFTLGAPLELLSPLSVLRLIYPLLASTWPLLHAVDPGPAGRDGVGWAVTAAAGAPWLGLLVVRRIDRRASGWLAAAAPVLAGGAVWATGWTGAAAAAMAALVLSATFVALFLGGRALAVHLVEVVVVVAVAGALGGGGPAAAMVAALATVAVAAASGTVWLLVRAADHSGSIDADTGLPNGVGVARRFSRLQPDEPVLVAVVELGGLSDAREALGFQVAGELMRRAVEDVGQVLPAEGEIGRIGGDELVVAMPAAAATVGSGAADHRSGDGVPPALRQAGETLAERLAEAVEGGRYLAGPVEVALRGHVGVAVGPWDGRTVADLVRRASLAAAAARADGVRHRDAQLDDGVLTAEDLALLADLRLAGERGELWMAYQPQVEATTGRVVAVEALLRWASPAHGSVPPGRFIPLAERTGLVDRLTEWVLVAVLDAAARWRAAGLAVPVSVNLSARTVGKPDLARAILGMLQERRLPPEALTVEVTETAAVDLLRAVHLLRPLHDHGVRVSIDDFGTGYTSLAALPQLPLDELKVDMGFVRRSATSTADEAIVRSVRELAHRLGLTAVAEGVENEALHRSMAAIGYDLLQGYHFSRPLDEDALLALLGPPDPASVTPVPGVVLPAPR